jgi:hypothetical protein
VFPSDPAASQQPGGRRSPGRVLLIKLIVVATLFLARPIAAVLSLVTHFSSGSDDRRFDELETEFDRGQAPLRTSRCAQGAFRPKA